MAGATSLVQLILKKWGDDIAGAAKELEQKVGFPESVANRIATGELPMDAESVARRADEQGYGETMLHGSSSGGYNRTHDIREIDPDKAGDKWGQDREGFFLTNDPVEADYYATTDSIGRTVDGTVYPLRYKSDSPMEISSSDDINLASEQPVGYWDERHGDLIDQAKAEGNDSISLLDYGPYEDKSHKMTVVLDPNSIRSPNAAFDPQYTGSNIMGGLALPAAAGLLAAGQSEDADAGFVTRGGKTLLEAWHSGPNKIDGAFNLSDRDIGIHLADNEALATNAAVKSGFERGAGRDQMQTSPYFIDAGADQVYDISASSNRFDAVDIVDELVAAGKIDAERGSQMVDDILSMEDSAFDVNQYMRDNLEDASGIRALRYQNSFDAGPTWEDIERGVLESDVQPAPSYMVFNPDYIQKGNATVPMLATAAGLSGGGLLAASLAAPEVKDSGMISAPRSETLFDLTMGARDLERRLEGSLGSLLFPSGLVEYLETVNRREEDPNAMTRGMALLDVLPF